MTTAAICATREVSWRPSFYRGEQYDSDLGLYYLRARYYNPATGRFLSRDPLDGNAKEPASLHKYLYANGDPVNAKDPTGRDAFEEGLIYGYVIVSVIKDVIWTACAIETAYALISDTVELAYGELGKKAMPKPPLLPQVLCGWYALGG